MERRDAGNSPGELIRVHRKLGNVPRVYLQKFTRNRDKGNAGDCFIYRNNIFRMLHLARNRSQSVYYRPSGTTPVHSQTAGVWKFISRPPKSPLLHVCAELHTLSETYLMKSVTLYIQHFLCFVPLITTLHYSSGATPYIIRRVGGGGGGGGGGELKVNSTFREIFFLPFLCTLVTIEITLNKTFRGPAQKPFFIKDT